MLVNGLIFQQVQLSIKMYQKVQYIQNLNQINEIDQAVICNNQVYVKSNHQEVGYCFKYPYMNQLQQSGYVISSKPKLVFNSLNTEIVKNVALNYDYQIMELYSFALFGSTTNIGIKIQNSILSVRIPQQLAQSALVCFSCDLYVLSSEFAFAAFGQNVSGMVLNSYNNMTMNDSLIQYRLSGVNVGGLLLQSQQSLIQISDVNISGYVSGSTVSGSLIAFVPDVIQVRVGNSKICSNINKYAGLNLDNLQLIGSFSIICDICKSKTYAYGLCYTYLENGELINNKFVCKNSFEFDGEQCQCPKGQVVNGSLCISVLNSVTEIILRTSMLNQSIQSLNVNGLETKVKELENIQQQISIEIEELKDLDEKTQNNIISSSSSIQNYIILNTTNALNNLELNSTILDQRIHNNVTTLTNQFKNLNQIIDDLNSNISILNDSLETQKESNSNFSQNIFNLNLQIQRQNDDIQQLKQVIIKLNKKIQCMNDNSSYQACPCYLEVPGATFENDVCICTSGASLVGGACVCTANSILSNEICVCQPQYSILLSGVCVCTITGQSIVGGVCTCPAGSILSGSTCVCNVAGSEIKQNTCVCTKDYKRQFINWNGGNYWCQDKQLCCSINDAGPSYTCSNGNTYWSGCSIYSSNVKFD
ncbi:Conserved_hypothetical protein [Hexamita inflata]|uniref:Uncharacterized protein n=1 Tax=Hexamita inflata TaxID=28002 RepID=A0AA86R553_9EUKA|nr:Conserved hypothetical protein [Hexamita inflata]CAI9967296.1 Conserved hypothetical protein [Hexamita inflata]